MRIAIAIVGALLQGYSIRLRVGFVAIAIAIDFDQTYRAIVKAGSYSLDSIVGQIGSSIAEAVEAIAGEGFIAECSTIIADQACCSRLLFILEVTIIGALHLQIPPVKLDFWIDLVLEYSPCCCL